jgi:uncharacterized protein (DUF433 family)
LDYRNRISQKPGVCGGQPVIKGTRVTLRTLLASLSEGDSIEEILADHPTLTAEDVRAVIAFAADAAREDLRERAEPGGARSRRDRRR